MLKRTYRRYGRGTWFVRHKRKLCASIRADCFLICFAYPNVLRSRLLLLHCFLAHPPLVPTIQAGLVAVLGFLSPWSVALALVDAYSIFIKQLPRHSSVTIVIIAGDLVLSFLALGAACSTASVADVLIVAGAPYCRYDLCRKYQYSAVMGFLCWTLLFASSLFNLWLLPYL